MPCETELLKKDNQSDGASLRNGILKLASFSTSTNTSLEVERLETMFNRMKEKWNSFKMWMRAVRYLHIILANIFAEIKSVEERTAEKIDVFEIDFHRFLCMKHANEKAWDSRHKTEEARKKEVA